MGSILEYIVIPFGWLMRVIYNVVGNYGLALLFFTIITRLLMLPLSISQQKNMAKQSVYNPLIQEVQKKYANNREKQNEEMSKLYTEYGINPTSGCLPMLIQFPIIMILYQVIQKPLRFLVGIGSEAYNSIVTLAKTMDGCPTTYVDTFIISKIQSGDTSFLSLIGDKYHNMVETLDFTAFGIKGMDLTQVPSFGWNLLVIIPVLSALSMIISQFITSKTTGQQMKGATAIIMYGMSIWIGYLGFTFPAALSLYWFYSNVIALIQTLVLKKFYNPEKIKEQVQAELEAKRAAKKKKSSISVTDEVTGEKIEKQVSESELAKLRLAKARALQEEHFRQQEESDLAAQTQAALDAEQQATDGMADMIETKKKKEKNTAADAKRED